MPARAPRLPCRPAPTGAPTSSRMPAGWRCVGTAWCAHGRPWPRRTGRTSRGPGGYTECSGRSSRRECLCCLSMTATGRSGPPTTRVHSGKVEIPIVSWQVLELAGMYDPRWDARLIPDLSAHPPPCPSVRIPLPDPPRSFSPPSPCASLSLSPSDSPGWM